MNPEERQNAGVDNRPSVQSLPMFHRILKATPETVRDALGAVRARFRDEVGEDTLGRLELVLAEVMNNIAEHAGDHVAPGQIVRPPLVHLWVVGHDGGLACALSDDGASLPAECLLPRDLPQIGSEDLPEGGFGWYLIQDLTQELCYYREGRRNFLAFRIPPGGVAE